jgi:hypothetical protein
MVGRKEDTSVWRSLRGGLRNPVAGIAPDFGDFGERGTSALELPMSAVPCSGDGGHAEGNPHFGTADSLLHLCSAGMTQVVDSGRRDSGLAPCAVPGGAQALVEAPSTGRLEDESALDVSGRQEGLHFVGQCDLSRTRLTAGEWLRRGRTAPEPKELPWRRSAYCALAPGTVGRRERRSEFPVEPAWKRVSVDLRAEVLREPVLDVVAASAGELDPACLGVEVGGRHSLRLSRWRGILWPQALPLLP